MALDYDTLLATPVAVKHQRYDARDSALYALGVGMGHDHQDVRQLAFVWEKDMRALPTSASTLAWTRFSEIDAGLNYAKLVHAEQRMVIHQPVPSAGAVYSELRVHDVVDRGADRGAMIYWERKLLNEADDSLISTQILSVLARGDGGFGGPERPILPNHELPERTPDAICEMPVSTRSALIYRLTGDLNPLHIDPALARKVGFDGPILHGLGTYGFIGHAVLRQILDYDASRLVELNGRFSAPVYPGDRLEVDLWLDGDIVSLRARAPDRGKVVFDRGFARIVPA